MQVPLQITLRNLPASPALTERIRAKVEKLEAMGRRIVSCSVTVDARHRHQHQGREFTVRVDLRVPGHEIVVTRDHHEDVYVALRDAFDIAVRETEEQTQDRAGRGEAPRRSAEPLAPATARLNPDAASRVSPGCPRRVRPWRDSRRR